MKPNEKNRNVIVIQLHLWLLESYDDDFYEIVDGYRVEFNPQKPAALKAWSCVCYTIARLFAQHFCSANR